MSDIKTKIRCLWWQFTGRHLDGSRHVWVAYPKPEVHYCSWDYCHCYAQQCKVCDVIKFYSDGADEVR